MQGMNLSLCVRRNWDKGHKLIIKRKSSWPFLTTISSIFSTISSLNILHDDSKKKRGNSFTESFVVSLRRHKKAFYYYEILFTVSNIWDFSLNVIESR